MQMYARVWEKKEVRGGKWQRRRSRGKIVSYKYGARRGLTWPAANLGMARIIANNIALCSGLPGRRRQGTSSGHRQRNRTDVRMSSRMLRAPKKERERGLTEAEAARIFAAAEVRGLEKVCLFFLFLVLVSFSQRVREEGEKLLRAVTVTFASLAG